MKVDAPMTTDVLTKSCTVCKMIILIVNNDVSQHQQQ